MNTRVVNVKLGEPFDLYIGRTMKQGYSGNHPFYVNQGWGNPFRGGYNAVSGGDAISQYRRWLLQPEQKTLLAHVEELAGKTLGCWCAPAGGLAGDIEGHICHGEILAALADDPERMIARMRQIIVRQDNLAHAAARAPDVMVEHGDGTVSFYCRRGQSSGHSSGRRRGHAGSAGSPVGPRDCPDGLDPHWCDEHTRAPYPADARFALCSRCGWRGQSATPTKGEVSA